MRPTRNPQAPKAVLYPFQTVGVQWLTEQATALLGDEMGLGKSVQAIRAADALELRFIVVVAPTNAIYNWRNEFEKFSLWDRKVQIVDKGSARIEADTDVVIITHGLIKARKIRLQLIRRQWDLVIADEAHAFKNLTAKQTQAFYGTEFMREPGSIAALAQRVWLLTGTPAENGAHELWTHAHALRPDSIALDGVPMSYHAFMHRYCVVRQSTYGPRPQGNRKETLPELRENLIQPFVLRRLKKNELKDLPPIRYDLVTVPPDHVPEDLKRLEEELGPALLAALADIENGVDATEVLKMLAAQEQKEGGLSRLMRLTGHLKVRPTVQIIEEHFAAYKTGKILVFARHLDVIDEIVAACAKWNPVKITGAVSASNRQQVVARFQTDPTVRVFVGQIDACATAATLTAADEVLFAEASWVPTKNAQAAARAHRIGQTEHVRVRFICLAGSIDEAVTNVLTRKVQTLAEIFTE